MEKDLRNLFTNHSGKITDRWSLYINEWENLFSPLRDDEIDLLEIGVHNGGSLEIWAKYFTKAKQIIGCDIDEACRKLKFDDPRIKVIVGDVNQKEVKVQIQEFAPEFNIIIDDGSHTSDDIITAFAHYFSMLAVNGIYLIEDLHSSYFGEHESGLFNPYSSMAFFKRLVDLVNFEHWQNLQSREAFLRPYETHNGVQFDPFDFYQLHAITFINSLCVIRKRPPEENALGKRIIAGSIELKPQNYHKLNGTSIHDLDKELVDDTSWDVFSLIKQRGLLETHLEEGDKSIQILKTEIAEQQGSISQLKAEINAQEQIVRRLERDLKVRDQSIQQLEADIEERKQVDQGSRNLIVEQNQVLQGLYEDVKARTRTIQELEDILAAGQQQEEAYAQQVQALDQKIYTLEHETLFYALSKSWRFTRPLRKVLSILRGRRHV